MLFIWSAANGRGCYVQRSDSLFRASLPALFFDEFQGVLDKLLLAALIQRVVDRKELARSHRVAHDCSAFLEVNSVQPLIDAVSVVCVLLLV